LTSTDQTSANLMGWSLD